MIILTKTMAALPLTNVLTVTLIYPAMIIIQQVHVELTTVTSQTIIKNLIALGTIITIPIQSLEKEYVLLTSIIKQTTATNATPAKACSGTLTAAQPYATF